MKTVLPLVALAVCLVLASNPGRADDAVDDLIKNLRSPDESVRLQAALELGQKGKSAATQVAALLHDKDDDVRYYAVWALGLIGPEAKDKAGDVIKLLGDKSDHVRRKAAFALGRIAPLPADAVPVLIKALNDGHADVRTTAATALAQFGQASLPFLVDTLKSDNATVRRQVIEVIGKIESDEAVATLVEALKSPRVDVRRQAVGVLGGLKISDKVVVLSLAEVLKNDDDDQTRIQAFQELKKRGADAKRVSAVLTTALIDDNPSLRGHVYSFLPSLDVDPDQAVARYFKGDDVRARINAAGLMASARGAYDESLPVLREALKDKEPLHRYQAAFALASVRQEPGDTIAILLDALKDKNPSVRERAAAGFRNVGLSNVKVLAAMAVTLKDESKDVRRQAALALSRSGEAKVALPAFAELIKDDDQAIRHQAIQTAIIFRQESAPLLIEALKDQHEDCRALAAMYLGEIGPEGKKMIAALVEAAKNDPDQNVRFCAFRALNNTALREAAIPAFVELLKADDAEVKQEAMVSLERFGAKAKSAVPALIELLKGDDLEDQWRAAKALGMIGPDARDAIDALKEAAKNPNPTLKVYAEQALQRIEKK